MAPNFDDSIGTEEKFAFLERVAAGGVRVGRDRTGDDGAADEAANHADGADRADGEFSRKLLVDVLGGDVVSPVIVLPALIPLLVLARLCAKSELSGRAITAYLVGGQLWVHTLASLTGHHASTHLSSMLTGHAIATAIAVVVIRRREAAGWAKARRQALTMYIAGLLRLLVPVPVHEPERIDVYVIESPFAALSAVIGQSVVRRGPPLGLN